MQIEYKRLKRLLATILFALLMSCGGGGGGETAGDGTNIPDGSGDGTQASPVQLIVGQARSASIGLGGRSYYYFTAAPGSYTISLTDGTLAWTLYSNPSFTTSIDSCGIFTATATCAASVTTAGNYYISVMNYSVTSGTNYTITVTAGGGNEGTIPSPIYLPVGTANTATIDNGGTSYYFFVADRDGSFNIGLTNTDTDLEWSLMSDAAYTSYLVTLCDTTSSAGNEICSTPNLVSGTTYYLRVTSSGAYDDTYTITINNGLGDGSLPNPVQLTIGQGYVGSIQGSSLFYGHSYYWFTTENNSTSSYKIDLTAISGSSSLGMTVYSDPAFSNEVMNCYQNHPCTVSALSPDTAYYLALTNWGSTPGTYTVTVTPGSSEGAPGSPVGLTLGQSRASTVDGSSQSYYSFTTSAFSGSYNISVTNGQTNLSWSLYEDIGFTNYSLGSGCDTVQTAGPGDEICMTNNIDQNKTYYLKISNAGSTPSTFTVTITSGGGSEGSKNYPIVAGASHNGSINQTGTSYYKFTTGSKAVAYLITLTNLQQDLRYRLYKNADFTNEITMACLFGSGTADDVCSTTQSTEGVLSANTTYYVTVENNAYGNVASTYTLKVEPLDPAAGCNDGSECYNFESGGTTPFIMTSTASSNKNASYWYIDSISSAGSGTTSVRSGTIGGGILTCIEYPRTSAASTVTVLFSFKTDSDATNYLEFMLDGSTVGWGNWSGATPWRRAYYNFSLTGTHTFSWCYHKYSGTVTGADAGWVDDIEFR